MSNVQEKPKPGSPTAAANDENWYGNTDQTIEEDEDEFKEVHISAADQAIFETDELAEEDDCEGWKFENHVVITPEELQAAIDQDVPLKEVTFTQHDFVKMNQVSSLINDAMQVVLKRLN